MKFWVKPVKEPRFALEINRIDQIEDVKAAIERARGFEAKSQKLVWRGRVLEDTATLEELNLHENDHLILLVSLVKEEEELSGLPFDAPFLAPAQTPAPAPTPTPIPNSGQQLDLQRMVMELASAFTAGGGSPPVPVGLSQPPASATPPIGSPFAVGSPNFRPIDPVLPEPDPAHLQMLTDMGFPTERAKKALWICRMDLEAATEWLLGHSDDPDVDDPLTSEQKRQLVVLLRGPEQAVDPRVQQAINANVCTFVVTGSQYTPQAWYQCYTCNLLGNEGCCEVCAQICHKGHQLSARQFSRQFFCDCGAGAHSFRCRALRNSSRRSGGSAS
jgi:hypothetical protein